MIDASRKAEVEKVILAHVSIESIFRDFNAVSELTTHRGDETLICCPFHRDDLPSLSINNERGKWHCFSCGKGGNVVTAYAALYHATKGRWLKYDEALEQLMLNKPVVKSFLDFTTIHVEEDLKVDSDFKPRRFVSQAVETSMLDVYRMMVRIDRTSFGDISQIYDLMLSGMQPDSMLTLLSRQEEQRKLQMCEDTAQDTASKAQRKHMTVFSTDALSVAEMLSKVDWS